MEGHIHWAKFTHLGNNIHEIHAFQERIREDGDYAFEPNQPLTKLILDTELVDMEVSIFLRTLVLQGTKLLRRRYMKDVRSLTKTSKTDTPYLCKLQRLANFTNTSAVDHTFPHLHIYKFKYAPLHSLSFLAYLSSHFLLPRPLVLRLFFAFTFSSWVAGWILGGYGVDVLVLWSYVACVQFFVVVGHSLEFSCDSCDLRRMRLLIQN